MKTINVRTSRPYNVIIERGSLSKSGELISQVIKSHKTVIITDDTVGALYADTLVQSLEKQYHFICICIPAWRTVKKFNSSR